MNCRVDELEELYFPIERLERLTCWLFWACAVVSLLLVSIQGIITDQIYALFEIAFLLLVVSHAIVSNYNAFYLVSSAEKVRRKQLLSDSLGIPLTHKKTQLYYNNPHPPSISRLGINILENSHFGKSICKEMLVSDRIRMLLYLLFWVTCFSIRDASLGFLVVLTQIMFSGDILFKWIRLEMLHVRMSNVYESLYALFLTDNATERGDFEAKILDSFADYESAKASASIKLTSKIFHSLNPKLSEEWEQIKRALNINKTHELQQGAAADAAKSHG